MNPLTLLWKGVCNIMEYQSVYDTTTHQTTHTATTIVENEPCRVSYTRESLVSVAGVPTTTQTILLFIRPDIDIKAGSVIEVTQNGRTIKYKGSSTTAKYTNHQEVVLELYEDKA